MNFNEVMCMHNNWRYFSIKRVFFRVNGYLHGTLKNKICIWFQIVNTYRHFAYLERCVSFSWCIEEDLMWITSICQDILKNYFTRMKTCWLENNSKIHFYCPMKIFKIQSWVMECKRTWAANVLNQSIKVILIFFKCPLPHQIW